MQHFTKRIVLLYEDYRKHLIIKSHNHEIA